MVQEAPAEGFEALIVDPSSAVLSMQEASDVHISVLVKE